MNNCCICCQGRIRTWIGEITFTNLLVYLLDSILIQYNTRIKLTISTDIGIQNHIRRITAVSILYDIFESAEVTYYLPSC